MELKPFNYAKKMSSGSFKNVIYKMCLEIMFKIYVLKGLGIKWLTMVDMA